MLVLSVFAVLSTARLRNSVNVKIFLGTDGAASRGSAKGNSPRNALWIFCARQNVVVPPLSHVKKACVFRVFRKIWLYHKLATQQENVVKKSSRHIIKLCESVIKERRNLLYYWLCHTIWHQDSRWHQVWQRLQLRLFCAAAFPICLSCYNYMINLMCRNLL